MAVPSVMNDLSTTAGTNSPAGTESPTSGDDFLRAIQAIVRTTNAKGSDIASATTTDIGAATAEFVDVTGTTTITGLGTIGAGIRRTVRFTGVLTLTYNATSLILPGSANITTANGDFAQFISLGSGNWVCTSYIKRDGSSIITGAPFIDSTAIIKGSADATKLVRIEADGLTTATTRVWTAQDKDITVAGLVDLPISTVRQTIYNGPVDSAGLSAFVGATGSSTVTATATLYATSANGIVNRTGSIVNPSWTGLTTNGTMYLYLTVNADGTCTTGSTTVAPVYQWGGSFSNTSGAFVFNIQAMTGNLGTGAANSQAYIVFVGEVTVAANVVSAITWYAIMGRYESANFGLALATQYSNNHNIGAIPKKSRVVLVNTTAELNYTLGDEVDGFATHLSNNSSVGFSPSLTYKNISVITAAVGSSGLVILNKTTGASAAITVGSWKLKAYVDRGW